jgi:YbgC/YbaW family acyl-CoA thioester hydrolase
MPFVTTRRVEFGDTDMAGIVHFSRFFAYMEAAETDFLLARGLNVTWDEGGWRYGFPRVAASCDYKSPARFGDTLAVVVTVEKVGRKSVAYRHEFSRAGQPVATGRITAVYSRKSAGGDIETLDIPPAVRAALEG